MYIIILVLKAKKLKAKFKRMFIQYYNICIVVFVDIFIQFIIILDFINFNFFFFYCFHNNVIFVMYISNQISLKYHIKTPHQML